MLEQKLLLTQKKNSFNILLLTEKKTNAIHKQKGSVFLDNLPLTFN